MERVLEQVVDFLVIPHDRVAVLIGKKGSVRRRLERECGVKIVIDSASGEVNVMRKPAGDFTKALQAIDFVRAVGRGFSPQKAFKLLNPNIILDVIDLSELVSERSMKRVRARIIGHEGKARKYISRLTKTDVCVYGKTVAFIGDAEAVSTAKEAVMKLVRGIPHVAVFKYVEMHKA